MAVGDTITLWGGYPTIGVCVRRATRFKAVVRFTGTRTAWLEDLENPSGTFADREFALLDTFYASVVEAVLERYFGELSDVDGNGKLLVLLPKEVNKNDDGIAGYVWGGDLFPERCLCDEQPSRDLLRICPGPSRCVRGAEDKEGGEKVPASTAVGADAVSAREGARELGSRSRKEWAELYVQQGQQRKQLAGDGRVIWGRFRCWRRWGNSASSAGHCAVNQAVLGRWREELEQQHRQERVALGKAHFEEVRAIRGSGPELCVKVRGSSSMLRLGCLGDLLGLEE